MHSSKQKSIPNISHLIQEFLRRLLKDEKQFSISAMLKHQRLQRQRRAQTLKQSFICNCIKISLAICLKDYSQNIGQGQREKIVQEMRNYYFEKYTQGAWKSEFEFSQNIVCVTKIVANFFQQTFGEALNRKQLQAEIFLVLIFLLIGCKVGIKSFAILEKKYLKKESSVVPKPQPLQKDRRYLKRMTKFYHNIRQSALPNVDEIYSDQLLSLQKQMSQEDSEVFKQNIKQLLYVPPLPKIKKERKGFSQIQLNSSLRDSKCTNEVPNVAGIEKSSEKKYIPFLSTQLSSSMHSQIFRRKVEIPYRKKPLKLKHRMPFNYNNIIFKNVPIAENNLKTQQDILKEKQKQEKCRMSCYEWRNTITNIKTEFSKKLDNVSKQKLYRDFYNDNIQSNGDLNLDPKSSFENKSPKFFSNSLLEYDRDVSRPAGVKPCFLEQSELEKGHKVKLQQGVRNFKQLYFEEKCFAFEEPTNAVTKKLLKDRQRNFQKDILSRNEKINYSIFTLPSMKNKQMFQQFKSK